MYSLVSSANFALHGSLNRMMEVLCSLVQFVAVFQENHHFVFYYFVFLTFLRYTNKLKVMLSRYHKLMEMMNEAEIKLLDQQVKELWRILKSGHKRLTWKSVGNGDFTLKWP